MARPATSAQAVLRAAASPVRCASGVGIRRARPCDARGLATLDALVSASSWQPAHFEDACREGVVTGDPDAVEYALVLEVGGELAGFVVVAAILDEASILNVAVKPSLQRRGMAVALLHAAFATMREAGRARCLLEVRESNAAAIRLYEKCGFRIDGIRRNYYPSPSGREDALLMSLQL